MTRRSLTRPMPALEAEPDLTKEQKEAVIAALQWGWNEVWSRWPEVIVSGGEEKITARLCEVLCEQHPDGRRAAPGLSLFETVNRGGKTRGADDRVEYQPDLVFRPLAAPAVRNLNRWGWFVECKLVDGASSVRRYCSDGVQRFIDGKYAPQMSSAVMLAYVRDEREAHTSLARILEDEYGSAPIAPPRRPSRVVVSHHDRSKTKPPCIRIVLWHLWLSARHGQRSGGHQLRLGL
jgi:hypothetical protein